MPAPRDQHSDGPRKLSRRQFQKLGLAVPAAAVGAGIIRLPGSGPSLAGVSLAQTVESTPTLLPTPTCADDDDPTPPQTAGPFFTPNSPERSSLREPDLDGAPLTVAGYVLSTACQPVANALLDFWQADDDGNYDNDGFRLRGHQFTDDEGRYQLETIVPGLYPGRTRHIHVNVQAPNQPVLTTQLYFPDVSENDRDGLFNPALVIDVEERDETQIGRFSFVLESIS